jgi:hypothetical protein
MRGPWRHKGLRILVAFWFDFGLRILRENRFLVSRGSRFVSARRHSQDTERITDATLCEIQRLQRVARKPVKVDITLPCPIFFAQK